MGGVIYNIASAYTEDGNLYSFEFSNISSSAASLDDEGRICIARDNTDGTAGQYINFFSKASDGIVGGNTYEVSYEIETSSITGTAIVQISSSGVSGDDADTYQLGEQNISKSITSAGTVTGSFTTEADANAEELPRLLRSYVQTPSGTAIECKIHISITEVATYSVSASVNDQTIDVKQTDDGAYLFLPSSADFTSLTLIGNIGLRTADGSGAVWITEDGTVVDLTALTGTEMQAGTEYTFELVDENSEKLSDVTIMKSDNLSSIFVISDKTIAQLHKSKSVTGTGTATMITADGVQVNSNTTMKKFKGRGNSSWSYSGEKRPYNLNLDKKAELIEGAGSAKKWCLISDNCTGSWVYEAAGLANAAALDVYKKLGGSYPINYEFVNLYINNEYRGVYMLTDKVEINDTRVNVTESTYAVEDEDNTTLVITDEDLVNAPLYWSSVDTSNASYLSDSDDEVLASGIQAYQYATGSELSEGTESGGFLLELDRNFYGEASWFVTRNGNPYVLKEPEFATKEQVSMIAQYIQGYEDALYNESGYSGGVYYADYIDMDSYVAKMLTDFVTGQCDTFVTSTYFSIDYTGGSFGKIVAGPAWDYDGSNYSLSTAIYYDNNTKYNVQKLFSHGDFAAAVEQVSSGLLKEVWQEEQDALAEYAEEIENSYKLNKVIWNENLRPYEFDTFCTKFAARYNNWYSNIYTDSKLLGVTAELGDDGVISAAVSGTADSSYSWLRLADDGESLTAVEGETLSSYEPTEDGAYYCMASGTSVLGLAVTEMYSNPVYIGSTPEPTAVPTATPTAAPTSAPTATPTAAPAADAAISTAVNDDGTVSFIFSVPQSADTVNAYVAEYNEYGQLTFLEIQSITQNGEIAVEYSADMKYKAFIWGGNCKPLCNALSL